MNNRLIVVCVGILIGWFVAQAEFSPILDNIEKTVNSVNVDLRVCNATKMPGEVCRLTVVREVIK